MLSGLSEAGRSINFRHFAASTHMFIQTNTSDLPHELYATRQQESSLTAD